MVNLDSLLHDGERRVEPADVHARALDQRPGTELERPNFRRRRRAVNQGDVVEGPAVGLRAQPAAVEAGVGIGRAVAIDVGRVVPVAQGSLENKV